MKRAKCPAKEKNDLTKTKEEGRREMEKKRLFLSKKTEGLDCAPNAVSALGLLTLAYRLTLPRPRQWFCPPARCLVFTPLDNSIPS